MFMDFGAAADRGVFFFSSSPFLCPNKRTVREIAETVCVSV